LAGGPAGDAGLAAAPLGGRVPDRRFLVAAPESPDPTDGDAGVAGVALGVALGVPLGLRAPDRGLGVAAGGAGAGAAGVPPRDPLLARRRGPAAGPGAAAAAASSNAASASS
jgi:hypothetical protein